MIQSSSNINWQGGKLFNNYVKDGMTLDQVMEVVDEFVKVLSLGQDVSCLNLKDYGIDCVDSEKESVFCTLFRALLTADQTTQQQMATLTKIVQNSQVVSTLIKDEAVKASKDSKTSKYLIDALTATAGRLKYDVATDTVQITGLLPIGSRMMIDRNRLGDFDGTGYGKATTDLAGWQIRNGNRGTDNALGKMPMYTDSLENAGKSGGSNTATLTKEHIPSMTFKITGSISEALADDIIVKAPYAKVTKHFGIGSSREVVVPDNFVTGYKDCQPINVKHSHSHDLAAAYSNEKPKVIDLVPVHIKEIPIQFVGF